MKRRKISLFYVFNHNIIFLQNTGKKHCWHTEPEYNYIVSTGKYLFLILFSDSYDKNYYFITELQRKKRC